MILGRVGEIIGGCGVGCWVGNNWLLKRKGDLRDFLRMSLWIGIFWKRE